MTPTGGSAHDVPPVEVDRVGAEALEITVVIPTFDRAHTLPRAVASVLAQTDAPGFEVVVVDDGSTDGTHEVLAELADPRLRVITQTNQGRSAARNAGAAAARGTALTFLDSDDEALPGWLAEIGRLLDPDRAPVVRFGVVRETGDVVVRSAPGAVRTDRIYPRGACQPGSFAVATALFERVGGYEPELRFSENTELLMRLALARRREGWQVEMSAACGVLLHQDVAGVRTRRYSREPRRAAELLITRYGDDLRSDPRIRSDLLAIIGVDELRQGRRGRAAATLGRAWLARPSSVTAAARLASVVLPDRWRRRLARSRG